MKPLLVLALALPAAAHAATLESLWSSGARSFDLAVEHVPAFHPSQTAAEPPMRLSELAAELQRDPQAIDDLLNIIVSNAGLMGRRLDTPERRAEFKETLRRADAATLDAFPTLSPAKLAEAAALYAGQRGPNPAPNRPTVLSYAPTGAPAAPTREQYLSPLGHGLFYGDEGMAIPGVAWGDSKAAASALDQLAANGLIDDGGTRYGTLLGWLGNLLAQGHTLEVRDRRMYANFGDLRFEANGRRRDVATPTLTDTGLNLRSGRRLIVPMTHSELDISIRGPRVNAELSWFFGVDGLAAFRAFDTRDQGWVGGRTVRTYAGFDAARLLDRAATVGRELEAKARAEGYPMGGYGPLGSCNDAHAFVTGVAPYGMIRDASLFTGNGIIDQMSRALPEDVTTSPDPLRVWESRAYENVNDIPMPEIRSMMLELKDQLGL